MKISYEQMLATAKVDPAYTDFTALRMAYAESAKYAPYGENSTLAELTAALGPAMKNRDYRQAVDIFESKLDLDYLNAEVHLIGASIYTQAGDSGRAAYHELWFNGLMKSLMDSGNGLSLDSAFVVISTQEEYTFLRLIGATPEEQALLEQDGHHFDVIRAVHPRTPEPVEFHFNIDIPYNWLESQRR